MNGYEGVKIKYFIQHANVYQKIDHRRGTEAPSRQNNY